MALDHDDADHDGEGRSRRLTDFDCPQCDANNPWDDGFGDGDEVRCFYCGVEFNVKVGDDGRVRLRQT